MRKLLVSASLVLLIAGCSMKQRDFIPNGSGVTLAPTDPLKVEVLDSIPRGLVIGTILVDRSKAKDTADIIAQAKVKAGAIGADFIVWEDSLGTIPSASPTPASGVPAPNSGALGHDAALPEPLPEQTAEKVPKARFTAGIFLSDGRH